MSLAVVSAFGMEREQIGAVEEQSLQDEENENLSDSIFDGDLDGVKSALTNGASISDTKHSGSKLTPLGLTIKMYQNNNNDDQLQKLYVDIARCLLEYGADPNFIGMSKDNEKKEHSLHNVLRPTTFFWSSSFSMFALLLEFGADLSKKASKGFISPEASYTPLLENYVKCLRYRKNWDVQKVEDGIKTGLLVLNIFYKNNSFIETAIKNSIYCDVFNQDILSAKENEETRIYLKKMEDTYNKEFERIRQKNFENQILNQFHIKKLGILKNLRNRELTGNFIPYTEFSIRSKLGHYSMYNQDNNGKWVVDPETVSTKSQGTITNFDSTSLNQEKSNDSNQNIIKDGKQEI